MSIIYGLRCSDTSIEIHIVVDRLLITVLCYVDRLLLTVLWFVLTVLLMCVSVYTLKCEKAQA